MTVQRFETETTPNEKLLVRARTFLRRRSIFKRVAFVVFAIQVVILIGISYTLFTHFDLTWDYAVYFQSWFLLAHGHLNPYTSVGHSFVWQGHLEWMLWPLALLYFLYPHGLTLLAVQDLAVVGAELAALGLICELVERSQKTSKVDLQWLKWLGLFFLVANPWSYWAVLFDFHFHSVEAFTITAATWQFYRGNTRWAFVFVFLCMFTSVVSITFLVPLSILLFFFLGQKRNGVILFIIGVSSFIGEQLIFYHGLAQLGYVVHKTSGARPTFVSKSVSSAPGLSSFLSLPLAAVRALKSSFVNIYSNLGPDGLLGILSPYGLFIPGLVLLESALAGSAFAQPDSQNIPAYAMMAVGTICVIVWIAGKSTRISRFISIILVVNELVWLAVGIAGIPERTSVPSSKVARVLHVLKESIPSSAEVVTNQGIIGRFSNRPFAYAISLQSRIPVLSSVVYFIVTPYSGINLSSVNTELSRIDFLASQPDMQLVSHTDGVWAFKWIPPYGTSSFSFGVPSTSLPAWAMKSAVGSSVLKGNPNDWYVSNSVGKKGYILSGAYWRLSPGNHHLSIRFSSIGDVNVEVWNATANAMLLRRTLNSFGKTIDLTADFKNVHQVAPRLYKGWGFFTFQPVARPPNNQIEVRIWTSGTSIAKIYTVGLQ